MTTTTTTWPEKKSELQDHHRDSTLWNGFEFRNDDVIVSTYTKCGTTWMQQIVCQLIFNGDTAQQQPGMFRLSPWIEFRLNPSSLLFGSKEKLFQALEEQKHRRMIKTHLPLDNLVFSPKAKYIFVGRDGRDVVWSLYRHHLNYADEFYAWINDDAEKNGLPLLKRPPPSVIDYFHSWLETDGELFVPFFGHIRSWWTVRHLPNVLLVHFSQLKNNLPSEIRRVANFLDIKIDELNWNNILEHCSFNYMKMNANLFTEDIIWVSGAKAFFKGGGTNNEWKDVLTKAEREQYEERAKAELGEEGARWLATGVID